MSELSLDTRTAARLLLDWQGLYPPRGLRGAEGLHTWLSRARCVQFDPLDRCGRNADLTLQSRIRDYRPELLRNAVEQEGTIVEGWDKQASFCPAEDWPGLSRLRDAFARHHASRFGGREELLREVYDELEARGPLSAADLEDKGRLDWHWGPTTSGRAALEALFLEGKILISRREGTRKFYDLPGRVIDPEIARAPDPHAGVQDYLLWRAERRLNATGMLTAAPDAWLGIDGTSAASRRGALETLARQGKAIAAGLDSGTTVWVPKAAWERAEAIRSSKPPSPQAALIAPLDNLMWDRRLIRELFDFDYVWEVYKPAAARRWGYYVLPVLYGDRLIARCEPVRDNARQALILKNWWWEPGVRRSRAMGAAIRRAFSRFLRFLDLPALEPDGAQWPAPDLSALDELRRAAG